MKIDNLKQLRELYDQPGERAIKKQLTHLDKNCINFIQNSPFVVISTVSKDLKSDASPRGGKKGFIKVSSPQTILIPDASGNNRLDSLSNIIETGSIGILFVVPGIKETLRINGTATISTSESLLNQFDQDFKPPKSCIAVKIEEAYLHCAKAFMRSELWDSLTWTNPKDFPTMGQMLKEQMGGPETPETREDMEIRYKKDL